jgi:hypothetical protein
MKKFLSALLALALIAPVSFSGPVTSEAQAPDFRSVAAGAASAVTYYPLIVKYVGNDPDGGTVTVDAATGDITLKTGPVASSTADATVECPVSGALGGAIDVSNAACDTFGEVVDAINGSANWVAVIQDGLRSDTSINTLTTLAETTAATAAGLALAGDGAVSLKLAVALVPFSARNDIRPYLNGNALKPAPFKGYRIGWVYTREAINGTGAGDMDVYSTTRPQTDTTYSATAFSAGEAESATLLFKGTGAADDTVGTFDFTSAGGFGYRQDEVIVVYINDATLTASGVTSLYAFGRVLQ